MKSKCVSTHTHKNAGFTLIEVIVVVLTIGILAAIVSPSWLAFVNRQRLNKANDTVLGALREAQREAKIKKRKYSVSFRIDNSAPQVAIYPDSETASNWQNLGNDLGLKAEQIWVGTNLTDVNQGGTSVNILTSTAKTITFDYNGNLPINSTTPLKVMVAIPQPGNTTQASNVKRCVIVQTLVGGMKTGKNTDVCN